MRYLEHTSWAECWAVQKIQCKEPGTYDAVLRECWIVVCSHTTAASISLWTAFLTLRNTLSLPAVSIATSISSISIRTMGWLGSPSPWYLIVWPVRTRLEAFQPFAYLARISWASVTLPRLTSHLGDSGRNHTKTRTMIHGIPCVAIGILQLISPFVTFTMP